MSVMVLTRFFTIGGTTVMLLLLVWVDDIWAAFTKGGREKILINTFVKAYARSPSNPNGYPIKLLGPVKKFVGLDVKHNIATNTLTLSNESYLKSMVPKFVTETELKTKPDMPASVTDKAGRKSSYDGLAVQSDLKLCRRASRSALSALASCLHRISPTEPR